MDILFNNYRSLFTSQSQNVFPNFPHLDNFIFNFDISLKNDSNKGFSLEFPNHNAKKKYQVGEDELTLNPNNILDCKFSEELFPIDKESFYERKLENCFRDQCFNKLKENLQTPESMKKITKEIKKNEETKIIADSFETIICPNFFISTSTYDELTGEFIEKTPNFIDPSFKNFKEISLDQDFTNDPHAISNTFQKSEKNLKIKNEFYSEEKILNEYKALSKQIISELQFKKEETSIFSDLSNVENILSMTNDFFDVYESDKVIPEYRKAQKLEKTSFSALEITKIKKNESQDEKKLDFNGKLDLFFKRLQENEEKNETFQIEEEEEYEEEEEENLDNIIENENKLAEIENRKFRIVRLNTDNSKKARGIAQTQSNNYEYAVEDKRDLSNFYSVLPKEKFAIQYPFELDDFQKRAILNLEQKESVFVAAHTSAGKTVVAEYAIALAEKHKTRAIYTSPIKALSNQKYREFNNKFKHVGIITGDVVKNSDASCLIVTTEILRNMLYKGADIIRDIEWVIFDEVHYVNNDERGVVWEETFIMLPEHIGIIMLSATVPNSMEFADWVGRTKRRKIYVQQTFKRPVPLEHNIYLLNKFHVIKEKDGPFLEKEFRNLIENIEKVKMNETMEIKESKRQQKEDKIFLGHWKDNRKKQMLMYKLKEDRKKFIQHITPNDLKKAGWREGVRNLKELINHCKKQNLLPCVFFVFSKKKIQDITHSLLVSSFNLITKPEAGKINVFFNQALKHLKPSDRELPQFLELRSMLESGFAVHHGDLLPLAKEIVEILFADGLVKVLFATETFAMGINMPAKTVIFYGLKKHDGINLRWLKSSEYTQMSGRAGRRGLDEKGNVVIYLNEINWLPDSSAEMKKIVDHKGESLESKFKMTYGIILNLLTAKDIDIIEMMKRSFYENSKFSQIPRLQKKLIELKKKLTNVSDFDCPFRQGLEEYPIITYNNIKKTLLMSNYEFFSDNSGYIIRNNKKISPPFYIVMVNRFTCEIKLALCISINQKINDKSEKYFKVLTVDKISDGKSLHLQYEEEKKDIEEISDFSKNKQYKIRVIDITAESIIEVYEDKLEGKNYGKLNTIPDFRKEMKIIHDLAEELIMKIGGFSEAKLLPDSKKVGKNFAVMNFKVDDEALKEYKQSKKFFLLEFLNAKCHSCPKKQEHLKQLSVKKGTEEEISKMLEELNEDNLSFKEKYEGMFQILQLLNYIDNNNIPLIKARVCKEVGGDLYLCELLMENLLGPLPPEEIVSVLSGFVNQFKLKSSPAPIFEEEDFPFSLHDALEDTLVLSRKIARLEQSYRVEIEDTETIVKNHINFSLAKVVYEWALQRDFLEICKLTEAQEGSIVKTIQRLEILLRDVRNAAKIMGNMEMFKKMEIASTLIKRDIVFATSLYLA